MIISLTGFMGCGKSCVGKILSEKLGFKFIDLDTWIEEHEGRSVRRIFSENGEAGFRRIETTALGEVIEEEGDMVLALGGGTLTSASAATMVHEQTECVYLKAGIDTLVFNLTNWPGDRPMLDGNPDSETLRRRIGELMSQRESTYGRTAHIILDIDGKDYDTVSDEIIALAHILDS